MYLVVRSGSVICLSPARSPSCHLPRVDADLHRRDGGEAYKPGTLSVAGRGEQPGLLQHGHP